MPARQNNDAGMECRRIRRRVFDAVSQVLADQRGVSAATGPVTGTSVACTADEPRTLTVHEVIL